MLLVEVNYIDHVEVEGTLRLANIPNVTEFKPLSWGLDRIDHQPNQALLNQIYTVIGGGDNVHVYVVDTGIRCTHTEFLYQDGRVNNQSMPMSRCLSGFDGVGDGLGTNDCNGHGTFCAGVVAGLVSGVAKNAFVHPVRTMACDGTGGYGTIMAGIEWISLNAITPAIVSMSIAAPASISIDQAITNLVNTTGITTVVAAGNFLASACNYSPARSASVITVGSCNSLNTMSWFSNFGSCTNIFAPGELIVSTWNTSDTAMSTLSGTSMACPHVAGVAALYLQQNVGARPSDVKQSLLDASEPSAVLVLQPNTTTKLLNTNWKANVFNISPRSFYNVFEGTTQNSSVTLTLKPLSIVLLTPTIDPTIGFFQPPRLFFAVDSSWSMAQPINLVLYKNPDYLDHSSLILWVFTSADPRYVMSPEGYVSVLDSRMFHQLPYSITLTSLHHLKGTTTEYCLSEGTRGKCTFSSGPDVVFQYSPTTDVNVSVSLLGPDTNFDTLLSVYDTVRQGNTTVLNRVACNDNSQSSIQSAIFLLPLIKNHTYMIMVDGWGGGGLFDFNVTISNSTTSVVNHAVVTTMAVQPIQLTALRTDEYACTQWNSRSGCPSVALTMIPSGAYFWGTSSWSPCDQACGGGIQHAVMQCYGSNYTQVDQAYCTDIQQLQLNQSCNMVACRSYSVFEGPWGECNQTCGGGIQSREVVCIDDLGNTAPSQTCSNFATFSNQRACNMQACSGYYWDVPSWNFCNAPCSGGKRFRDTICKQNGSVVDETFCSSSLAPVSESLCNTQPCQTYAWLVGPWSDCPVGCGYNNTRFVECVDGWGARADDSQCDVSKKPVESMDCQHPNVTCGNCMQNNCSGNGYCSGGQCVCSGQWTGLYCETLNSCAGLPSGYYKNGTVGCCPYHLVDIDQNCCLTSTAALTSDGLCCEGGQLDACGKCNGTAIFVDAQSMCCNTVRDEKGICCKSGILDECHICDGDSTSCATNITVTLIFDSELAIPHNDSSSWKPFMVAFIASVGSVLGLGDNALILSAVQLSSTYTSSCDDDDATPEGCLAMGTPQVKGTFDFSVLPIPMVELGSMVIKKADIADTLLSLTGVEQENFEVESVTNAQRAGICGNGMCENGERCDSSSKSVTLPGNTTCCLMDCPFVSSTCPIPLSGAGANKSCAGNGICLDASGQCRCFGTGALIVGSVHWVGSP
ncbi:unnamed protein product [Sphagnum troendelagicum]|uniref:Peptidase S8/S53 domain-containing protein n=1 Tax=Sphagnum troendelagicum TaxID=128251 RepID=A0ABP0V6V1_9BRYO